MMNEDLKLYMLEYNSLGGEPLYILISNEWALSSGYSYQDIIECIHELYSGGYLKCYHHALGNEDTYLDVRDLSMEQLKEYIRKNEKDGFEDYPKEGGEYFFETTEEGRKIIPEDYIWP